MYRDSRKGRIIYSLFLVVATALIVYFAGNFARGGNNETSKGLSTELTGGKCTIEVECKTVLDHRDMLDLDLRKLVPKGGIILKKTEVDLEKNDSAFTVLARVLKENDINYETSGTSDNIYVKGIGDFYEFSCGQQSGWLYSVNGVQPKISSAARQVKAGDEIVWHFTCELGDFK